MSILSDPLLFSANSPSLVISAHHRSPRLAPRPQVGTFRRRRIAVAALSLFVLGSGAIATTALANKPGVGYQGVPRTVIAAPGDSLWNIARRIAPTGNISSLVDQLVRLNGEQVSVGQIVRIP
ncbi:MAG: hypothetical protein EXQ63_06505 [Ilumatobacteraceae bacterium]|nr:hypothetical protein [Ilumatobacteraceae bacterium]